MSRFVVPESQKLDLTNGDWLIVRKRLNTGERRDAYRRAYVENSKGEFVAHPALLPTIVVCAYLLDWNLADNSGQQMAIRGEPWDVIAACVDALDPEDFTEIRTAINTHEERMVAERAAQKKTRPGATPSLLTSGSRPGAAGPLTTSDDLMMTSATS